MKNHFDVANTYSNSYLQIFTMALSLKKISNSNIQDFFNIT